MARFPNWHVQSAGGLLVVALSWTAPAADRPALWHEALEIRRALVAPLSRAVSPIPAAPGMDVDRQRSRRDGRRVGRVAGAVIGFFGFFIVFSTFMAGLMGPRAPGVRPPVMSTLAPFLLVGFFGGMIGGLLIGAVAGSWVGGRVADLRYRPSPGGVPAPRICKGWVAAGGVLGWILGAVIGMGLTALFAPGPRVPWLMPILFFTPPVLCLVLGGFAGLNFARRRAVQRTGK
jgi:hypothetical protein